MRLTQKRQIRLSKAGPEIRCGIKDSLMSVPVSVVLMYDQTLDAEKLSASLSEALPYYPFFAGSLRRTNGHLILDCSQPGVQFEVVHHDRTLNEACRSALERGGAISNVRTGWRRPGPLLHVRVNQFRDGGTVLGVNWNHSAGDAMTAACFLRAWSEVAAGRTPEASVVPLDRAQYMMDHTRDDQTPSEQRLLRKREIANYAVRLARYLLHSRNLTLHFSEPELAALRADLQKHVDVTLSTNDALVAHVCSILGSLDPRREARPLMLAINWRSRIDIPATVGGNLSSMLTIAVEPNAGPEHVAAQLRRAISDWKPNYHSLRRFYEQSGGISNAFRMVPSGVDLPRGSIGITNVDKFGYYDVTFGGAPPSYAVLHAPPFPWFASVIEGYGNRGRQVSFSLPAPVVDQLTSTRTQARLHRYRQGGEQVDRRFAWLV